MKRFTTVNRGDSESQRICLHIKNELSHAGFTYDAANPELVVCVGGDGTLLKAFHEYLNLVDNVAFVGIHTGTLGFSTDYTQDQVDSFIHDVIHNTPTIDEKRILEVMCTNTHKTQHFMALNEVRVENIVKTQAMDIFINDQHFETFRGNGVCISGQYGSTAYNRSIGGAVIYPGLDLLQMTEISGIHHRHARSLGSPLVMNPEAKITLKHESFDHALLCYDHLHIHLDNIHTITIKNSDQTMKFARFKSIPHIQRLNALF
ncbi:NAD kinase [Erysipelothrix sp. HDW6C]|uniref:NAD kinase n=1 Tax=Erysipelothrix sp. HDW6C TaxID=2714930 RepID=UPI0014084A92|nr:NAD kinase [Erysipelothrix sp. HDW6C]QIK69094.1 NAD kinase [Erysipelothrix sp. HDW6C]